MIAKTKKEYLNGALTCKLLLSEQIMLEQLLVVRTNGVGASVVGTNGVASKWVLPNGVRIKSTKKTML